VRTSLLLIAVSLFAFSSQVLAQSPTAPAKDFNMFVEFDAHLWTNETEGPAAIGCNLNIKGNYQVSTNHTGTFSVGGVKTTLIVGNKVYYTSGNSLQVNQNGYVKIGNCTGSNVWYTDQNGANSPIRVTKNNYYNSSPYLHLQANAQQLGVSATNNPICEKNLIDFGSAFVTMRQNALDMSKCTHNAQLTNPNGQTIPSTNLPSQVKLNLSSGKNVLNITGSDLNNVQVFTFNNKPSASQYLVVNVDAPGTFTWNVWNQAGIGFQESKYIIYNFYNTTTLKIAGNSTVNGTVFAPFAKVEKKVNQANIQGQVIATFFYHKGGELHYAPFAPTNVGCGTPAQPTVASFTTDSSDYCVTNNLIRFSNTSTGQGNISFQWNFGDGTTDTTASPIHTYAAAGTYQVQLIATSASGADTTTNSVEVFAMPNALFSVNDTIQDSTNNLFVFTPNQLGNGATHSWTFGDGNQSVSSNPQHTYAGKGGFRVTHDITDSNSCKATFSTLVVVECDSVGSGNDGGLESHSLSGVVSAMYFDKKTSSEAPFSVATAPVFVKNGSSASRAGGSPRLEQFFPASLAQGGTAVKSAPSHLLPITNADEITSVDYLMNGKIKASMLASVSQNRPYSHTKYTCDRFLNSSLTYVDEVEVDNITFPLFVSKRHNGVSEYAVEFSAGFNAGESSFTIQNGWLIDDYTSKDTMYNFQVWSTNHKTTIELATTLLQNLASNKTLQVVTEELPKVYISKGYRANGELFLTVVNTTEDPYLTMRWVGKQNENSTIDTTYEGIVTAPNGEKELSFTVNDAYEFDIYLSLNGNVEDKVYMADANWGVDYDGQYTTVQNFDISNDPSRDVSGQYPLYRNVTLAGSTEDYISLYKDLTAGNLPTDVSSYKGVEFFAAGEGELDVRLVSDAITQWDEQFKTTITLKPEGDFYHLTFDEFTSTNTALSLPKTQLSTFVLTYESATFAQESFDLEVSNAAFVNTFTSYVSTDELTSNSAALRVVPNPNTGVFALNYGMAAAGSATLTVTDAQGRTLMTENIEVLEGNNRTEVSLPTDNMTSGYYIVTLTSEGQAPLKQIVVVQ